MTPHTVARCPGAGIGGVPSRQCVIPPQRPPLLPRWPRAAAPAAPTARTARRHAWLPAVRCSARTGGGAAEGEPGCSRGGAPTDAQEHDAVGAQQHRFPSPAVLQEALRVVLNEQAKLIPPLLRQELHTLLEQVDRLPHGRGDMQETHHAQQMQLLQQISDRLASLEHRQQQCASGGGGGAQHHAAGQGAQPPAAAASPVVGRPDKEQQQHQQQQQQAVFSALGPSAPLHAAAASAMQLGEPSAATSAKPSADPGAQEQRRQPAGGAGGSTKSRRRLRSAGLLDYVTLSPSGRLREHAFVRYGIVISMDGDKKTFPIYKDPGQQLQVRYLNKPYEHVRLGQDDVVVVPRSQVPQELRLPEIMPYDPARPGAPVTPFTAASGMLVRRGHDWWYKEDTNGADGEVGVLQDMANRKPSMWTVVWASGATGYYCTGKQSMFELSHVPVCEGSGAPVMWGVGSQQLQQAVEAKAAVVRGAHWVPRDGAAPTERGSLQKMDAGGTQSGRRKTAHLWTVPMPLPFMHPDDSHDVDIPKTLQVQWHDQPEGYAHTIPPTPPRDELGPHRIFPLNYVARPGDPVTVMTARKGLRVTLRQPPCLQPGQKRTAAVAEQHAAAASAPASGVGTLGAPICLEGDLAWWTVDWDAGEGDGFCRVGATHQCPCELQVAE